MARGGARARSGPAPDPNALRRERDGDQWVTLPPEGRKGETPEWPLPRPTQREKKMWEREWTRPQAVEWERLGLEFEVAIYVRTACEAAERGASAATRTLLRQQQEALGISVPGLARNRWRIGSKSAATPVHREQRQHARSGSARNRFKVMTGGRA